MFLQFLETLLRNPRLGEGVAWGRRDFAAGDALTTEGAVGESLFVITEGELDVVGQVCQGQSVVEVPVAQLTVGAVCGESSLIGDYPSVATVRASTAGRVLEINGAMLSVYLDDHPAEGYLFFKYLLAVALDNLADANRSVVTATAASVLATNSGRQP